MRRSILDDYHAQQYENPFYSLKGIGAEAFMSGHLPFGLTYSNLRYRGRIAESKNFIRSSNLMIERNAQRQAIEAIKVRNKSLPKTFRGFYTPTIGSVQKEIAENIKKRTKMGTLISSHEKRIKSFQKRGGLISKTSLVSGLLLLSIDAGFSMMRDFSRKSVQQGEARRSNEEMPFLDTGTTYTSRQRSLAALHNSQLHARAVLGNEAQYMNF